MIPECLGILIIVVLLIIDFLRRGKKRYALSTLPLLILPAVHILTSLIFEFTNNDAAKPLTFVIADTAAALLTVVFLFFREKTILSKRNRMLYFFGCSGYTLIVAAILILVSIH